jgi:hypothetical protein
MVVPVGRALVCKPRVGSIPAATRKSLNGDTTGMKQLKTIKTFEFDSAHYRLDDGRGNSVMLDIDYKNNQYHITNASRSDNQAFRQEIAEVAVDLLRRKHGVNFAHKS